MDESLLDTDLLSEILKRKNKDVLASATEYLAVHQRLWLGSMVKAEEA